MRKKKEEALDVEGKAPQTNFHMSHRGKEESMLWRTISHRSFWHLIWLWKKLMLEAQKRKDISLDQ